MRAMMRKTEAINRNKDTKYRKCYIAYKVTSIPWPSDRALRSRYVPRAQHHPFDTAIPQIGDNMFEDIEIFSAKAPAQKRKKAETTTTQNETAVLGGQVTAGGSSSEAIDVKPNMIPVPKRKRSATDTSVHSSDKENQEFAPPTAKRAKKTPKTKSKVASNAPLRRSTRLSGKKV